jgi:hypothetical protein
VKKVISVLICGLMICGLSGCGTTSEKVLTAEEYASKLKDAGLAIENVIVSKAETETDENKLLGEPNQYTSKVNFDNGSIEVFENKEDAKERKKYIDSIGEKMSMLTEYSYINGFALLRMKHKITLDEANKYETEFNKL